MELLYTNTARAVGPYFAMEVQLHSEFRAVRPRLYISVGGATRAVVFVLPWRYTMGISKAKFQAVR